MFTENELEKDPLKEVPAEPYELLDKTRYDFSSKQLPEEREAQLDSIMNKLREECAIKGIMVRRSDYIKSCVSPMRCYRPSNLPSYECMLLVCHPLMNLTTAQDCYPAV